MRVKIQIKEPERLGNKRTINRFLFLPTILDSELRWLEEAKIEQIWGITNEPPPGTRGNFEAYMWFDLHWL